MDLPIEWQALVEQQNQISAAVAEFETKRQSDSGRQICAARDDVTGAVCSLFMPHEPPHRDARDSDFIVEFPEPTKLVLPDARDLD